MGDDPMALLGLEGALKHYYYYNTQVATSSSDTHYMPGTTLDK
jgi:hypothetical protein